MNGNGHKYKIKWAKLAGNKTYEHKLKNRDG